MEAGAALPLKAGRAGAAPHRFKPFPNFSQTHQ
jgi:hypothetical protein